MDESKKEALRQCHSDHKGQIKVRDLLTSLHVDAGGFLNDVERDSIEKKRTNVEKFDELIDILLKKENKDFDYYCTVLEKEGYTLSSTKLREAAGLGNRQ